MLTSSMHLRHTFLTIALTTTALIWPFTASSKDNSPELPSGEKVTGGSATFDRSQKNTLNINQSSDRLVVEWGNGFNIGEGATTNFVQPNSSSIVVNKVTSKSSDPTRILGTLNANGRVVILDRNGVIFDKSSKVNVGSIVASTGEIDDKAFMKGGPITIKNMQAGKIENLGSITVAETGLAAFVAPDVRNKGMIVARMGTVLLGNAESVTLDLYGDGLIEVAAPKDIKKDDIDVNGGITVEGGHILLTAGEIDGVVKNLINTKDVFKGDSFKVVNGRIIVTAAAQTPAPTPVPTPVEPPVVIEPTPAPTPEPTPVEPTPEPAPIPDPDPVGTPVTIEPTPEPVAEPEPAPQPADPSSEPVTEEPAIEEPTPELPPESGNEESPAAPAVPETPVDEEAEEEQSPDETTSVTPEPGTPEVPATAPVVTQPEEDNNVVVEIPSPVVSVPSVPEDTSLAIPSIPANTAPVTPALPAAVNTVDVVKAKLRAAEGSRHTTNEPGQSKKRSDDMDNTINLMIGGELYTDIIGH